MVFFHYGLMQMLLQHVSVQLAVAMALKSTYFSLHSAKPTYDKATVPVMVARPTQDVLVGWYLSCMHAL